MAGRQTLRRAQEILQIYYRLAVLSRAMERVAVFCSSDSISCEMAEACGNRTHQRRFLPPLAGFEVQKTHQDLSASAQSVKQKIDQHVHYIGSFANLGLRVKSSPIIRLIVSEVDL